MWLKHTLGTQLRHRKARQPGLSMWERHFRLSQPLLHSRHGARVYCTGQVWALESHIHHPYILHSYT